jgi:hypothetical protein
MRADLVDQLVARHRKPTRLLFELLQKPQPFRSGQHVIGQLEHTADRIVQRVEALHDPLPATRNHVRTLPGSTDKNPPTNPRCGPTPNCGPPPTPHRPNH